MQIPKSRLEKLKVRDESPIPLTEDGLARLKERLARLRSALPNFITETQRTAAYGDRSDSAEYKEAKGNLRRAHRQILSLRDQIKRAVVIKPGPSASGKVQLGSTVVLEINGTEKTFQILGSYETDPARGRISHLSPLGAALMNHAKGDTVTIQTASGSKKYRILEIR
jgi:transcription elongation factor GreA